jgi:hypothetical protein
MLKGPVNRRSRVTTRRDPQRTQERLLQAAFEEIHKSGFRGTDVETILRAAGVMRGPRSSCDKMLFMKFVHTNWLVQ